MTSALVQRGMKFARAASEAVTEKVTSSSQNRGEWAVEVNCTLSGRRSIRRGEIGKDRVGGLQLRVLKTHNEQPGTKWWEESDWILNDR
ncbi:uncharacterized protein N7496_011294 [Penicillium cataractarum]|uniref:Uncharacterized protein n=1 Tax=Penicillium cataractarum TaxID=2100454 RepID=A0A9W9RF09_9EURO|nr:uncharacterized protein N7496_011294 [Penicillium cataractarum]KAJ5358881.1 hypothetical protein N7496_011294 [Penicillium cataractarum]